MAQAWRNLEDGSRTWARWPGAVWRYDQSTGDITAHAADGSTIDVSAGPSLATARRLAAQYASAIQAVTGDPWYTRAMLGMMCLECPVGLLPCYGDCWSKTEKGKVVKCGTPDAQAPAAVGLYQLQKGTAEMVGSSWAALEKDPDENHRAAFKFAKLKEPQHMRDFPSLMAIWQAGSVRQGGAPWGVVTYRPDTLTRYVRGWNAVGQALREKPAQLPGTTPGAPPAKKDDWIAWAAIALAVVKGFKLGKAIGL